MFAKELQMVESSILFERSGEKGEITYVTL